MSDREALEPLHGERTRVVLRYPGLGNGTSTNQLAFDGYFSFPACSAGSNPSAASRMASRYQSQ